MSNLQANRSQVATPADVERRLINLSKEIDSAHLDLVETESKYQEVKSNYEISMAQSRMKFASISSPTGKNYTVQERDDMALIENEPLHMQMGVIEALVKGSRANMSRVRVQVDITRSISASIKASMEG